MTGRSGVLPSTRSLGRPSKPAAVARVDLSPGAHDAGSHAQAACDSPAREPASDRHGDSFDLAARAVRVGGRSTEGLPPPADWQVQERGV